MMPNVIVQEWCNWKGFHPIKVISHGPAQVHSWCLGTKIWDIQQRDVHNIANGLPGGCLVHIDDNCVVGITNPVGIGWGTTKTNCIFANIFQLGKMPDFLFFQDDPIFSLEDNFLDCWNFLLLPTLPMAMFSMSQKKKPKTWICFVSPALHQCIWETWSKFGSEAVGGFCDFVTQGLMGNTAFQKSTEAIQSIDYE